MSNRLPVYTMKEILLPTGQILTEHYNQHGILFLLNIMMLKTRLRNIVPPFIPLIAPTPLVTFLILLLMIFIRYVIAKKLKSNTATGLDGWRPAGFKQLPNCTLSALLDVYKLCETSGHFPSSFYFSYTILIPKGVSRAPP